MELFNYYSLDECIDKKSIIKKLKSLEKDGKIEYELDRDVLHINDIDLEESDIEELNELFDKNDVFPYLDKEDDDEGYTDDYDGEYDDY